MIDQLKAKLNELEEKKSNLKPRIEEIELKRAEELAEINRRYDHMVADASAEVEEFENKILNDFIDLFIKTIMDEFDAKRSTSDYRVTNNFVDFRDQASTIQLFPKELVEKMDKVIKGDPIENIAYEIEKIESTYKRS